MPDKKDSIGSESFNDNGIVQKGYKKNKRN